MNRSFYFLVILVALANGCEYKRTKCTFNYSDCKLNIEDETRFVKELMVDGVIEGDTIHTITTFQADSLKKNIDLCSIVNKAIHRRIEGEIGVRFVLVKNTSEKIGALFFLYLNPQKLHKVDSVITLQEIRY